MVPGQPFGFNPELWEPTLGLALKPGGTWDAGIWCGDSMEFCSCSTLVSWVAADAFSCLHSCGQSVMETVEEVGGRL